MITPVVNGDIPEEKPRRWSLGLVRVAGLKVDPSYHDTQRYSRVRAERIAAEWDLEKAGTVTVSERADGSQWLIDGQHRCSAARICGIDFLPGQIFHGLSVSEEAAIFYGLSDFVRLRPEFQWRARLVAQEPVAVAITRAMEAAGVRFASGGSSKGDPRATRSFGAVTLLYDEGLLGETLSLIRSVWPEDAHGLDAIVLYGIGSFIAVYRNHPRFVRARLAAKLAELPASAVIRIAKEMRGTSIGKFGTGGTSSSGSRTSRIVGRSDERRAVLAVYNRHLRSPLPDTSMSDLKALNQGQNPWL